MSKEILIKPIISEKSESLSDNLSQYSFIVNKKANKVEIKKAVEEKYNVSVNAVNTMVMPKKSRTRNTKSGILRGHLASYKKAIVSLADGEEIDLFGEI